jgi:hypothetical protein
MVKVFTPVIRVVTASHFRTVNWVHPTYADSRWRKHQKPGSWLEVTMAFGRYD